MEWKAVKGYKGVYEVSNTGIVKRIGKHSNQYATWEAEHIMKPQKKDNGYMFMGLSKNGDTKMKYVHRLVGEAFLDKPDVDEYLTINHKDGNKTNNNVENLEWVTYSQNNKHSYDKLNKKTLKNNPKVSKPVLQIDINTNEVINKYPSMREAQRQTGISSIGRACNGYRKTAGGYKWQYQKV